MKKALLLPLMLAAPLLMAPKGTLCPVCATLASVTLDEGASTTESAAIKVDQGYQALIEWSSGSASLQVDGPVGNLACSNEGDAEYCTFYATQDGEASLKVTGLEDETEVTLYFGELD